MTSRGLPLLRKAILYRACVRNAIIYGRDAWPVKKYHLIRLKKNDGKWLEKCAMLYKIKDHRKCLQNKRLDGLVTYKEWKGVPGLANVSG